MSAEVLVSILALIVSIGSFSFAWAASRQAARAEEIKNLLGDKESVGFGALKLLRDGLPGEREPAIWSRLKGLLRRGKRSGSSKQRDLIVGALMAACLFERSDRARSLLYRVIERYRDTGFRSDFDREFAALEDTLKSMKFYAFTEEELDPASAKVKLDAVRKVLQPDTIARA